MNSTDLPVDGYGGYLYDQNITFPSYDGASYNLTYQFIDKMEAYGTGVGITYGACFGVCLITLIHMVALTSGVKRTRPAFVFIVIGLLVEIARLLVVMWANTKSGDASFYAQVAPDTSNVNYTLRTKVCTPLNQIFGILAYIAVELCFYLQCKVIMANMRKIFYYIILTYLVCAGVVALIFRCWEAAIAIKITFVDANSIIPTWLQESTLALYSVSIGSWCLVFSTQVGFAIRNRLQMGPGVERSRTFDILLMASIESMFLPGKYRMISDCALPLTPLMKSCSASCKICLPTLSLKLKYVSFHRFSFSYPLPRSGTQATAVRPVQRARAAAVKVVL